MAFTTIIGGFTPTQADGEGLLPFGETGYSTLNKTQFRNTLKDIMQAGRYQSLAGVLSGGVCTAAANVVTVPAGTVFRAGGMVWQNASAETKSFADGDTWLWGCSDGELRTTTTSAQDAGFTGDASCLLTKGNTVSAVTTLDNTQQQRARTADHTNRIIGESAKVFAPVLDNIPAGFVGVVLLGSQYNVFDKLTIAGKIISKGKVRVSA